VQKEFEKAQGLLITASCCALNALEFRRKDAAGQILDDGYLCFLEDFRIGDIVRPLEEVWKSYS
jgi:hypothetical protein